MQRDSSDWSSSRDISYSLLEEIIAIKYFSVELKGGYPGEELHCITYKSRERTLMVRAAVHTCGFWYALYAL